MATSSPRLAPVLFASLLSLVSLTRGAVADFKLGDVAETDVVTPVPLLVINPEATEVLKQKASQEVRFVVRHAPQVVKEAEADLREQIAAARRNFMLHLQQADFESAGFTRVIREVARSSPKDLPFDKLAPLWTRGQTEEPVLESLLQPIREVMATAIVNNKTDTPLPTNQPVRLVTVTNLNDAPSMRELEAQGQVVPSGKVLSLWRAKRLVETSFPAGQEALGRFASTFVRINAAPDNASTEILRGKRMEGLTVNDSYD